MLELESRIKCSRVVSIMVRNSSDDVCREVGSNANVKKTTYICILCSSQSENSNQRMKIEREKVTSSLNFPAELEFNTKFGVKFPNRAGNE